MRNLSAKNRAQYLSDAEKQEFDLIIIGGGVTGAGIALDAASRGMKVILLEKKDFASGTSSKSTKLIHGGLRYLKQVQFGVVYQTGQERSILYKNAPHLVRPEPMLLPVIKNGSLGKLTTTIALWVYETLAGVKSEERFKMLNAEQTMKREPLLDRSKVLGSAVYTEYRTDDSRLTMSIIKTAVKRGAVCINYTNVSTFIKSGENVVGINLEDLFSNKTFSIRGTVVVNAAGPWVDELRKADGYIGNKHLLLSKGVHIVFPFEKFPVKQSTYFDTSDGRMIFAIPRDGITYVGTTDTEFKGDADNPLMTNDDQTYLIAACNIMFPTLNLKSVDVKSSWTGLRPLIFKEGKGSSELSRKDELFESPSGLISIAGGKLTGYRVMAKKTVDLVAKRLKSRGKLFESCITASQILVGGDFSNEDEIARYIEQQIGEAKQIEVPPSLVRQWVYRYGKETERIVELGYEIWPSIKTKGLVPIIAEMYYCVEEEMVLHPCDFWIRRTGTLFFNFPNLAKSFETFYPYLAGYLNYSETQKKEFEYQFYAEMDAVKPSFIEQ